MVAKKVGWTLLSAAVDVEFALWTRSKLGAPSFASFAKGGIPETYKF
jgi:hypothetical protein